MFLLCRLSKGIKENTRILEIMDVVLFLSIGLAGIILSFLWFGTDHYATKDNLNLLWAFPTHLLIPFFRVRYSRSAWLKYYFLFWMVFLILFLASWTILPQQLNLANIPVILILIIRFYFNYKKLNLNVERRQ